MSKKWTTQTLLLFVEETRIAGERNPRGPFYEHTRSFFYAFTSFASQICNVAQAAVAANPEAAVALAAAAVLLKAFNARADVEAKVIDQIKQISGIMPTVEFLKARIENQRVADAVTGICSEVAAYLFEAITYFKKPRIRKVSCP